METAVRVLDQLQGVWFPTHLTVDGQLCKTHDPVFPAGRDPWVLTILGDTVHVTAMHEYYATGGRLQVFPADGRLTLAYAGTPEEFWTRYAYRLAGDELLLSTGVFPWSGPHDPVAATRYVRVAPGPTPEMVALIERVMQGHEWQGATAEPRAAPDAGR